MESLRKEAFQEKVITFFLPHVFILKFTYVETANVKMQILPFSHLIKSSMVYICVCLPDLCHLDSIKAKPQKWDDLKLF